MADEYSFLDDDFTIDDYIAYINSLNSGTIPLNSVGAGDFWNPQLLNTQPTYYPSVALAGGGAGGGAGSPMIFGGGYGGAGAGAGSAGGYGISSLLSNPALVSAAIGGAGALVSATGTQAAQEAANRAAALSAAQQSAQSLFNYLSARGINTQQLLKSFPEFQTEYERVRAQGETRDFNTWLAAAIQAQPNHPIWDAIARPTVATGAQNTTLPAWALDANGNPLQPALMQQLVAIANQGGTMPGGNGLPSATVNGPKVVDSNAPIGELATEQRIAQLFQSRPELRQEIVNNMEGSDDQRTPEQWLRDHVTVTEAQAGGGTFTDALRSYVAAQNPQVTGPFAPGGEGAGAAPAGVTGLDPRIADLISAATGTAEGIFNGSLRTELNAGLDPVAEARRRAAELEAAKVKEQQDLSSVLRNTELGELGRVLAARTGGAESIYGATIAGAAGVRDAGTAAAQAEHSAAVDKLQALLGVRREAAEAIYAASIEGAGGVRAARETGAQGLYGAELTAADTYAESSQAALDRLLAQQSANRRRQGFGGGSSGSDLTKTRLTAEYLQKGAGARAGAGVNLAGRMSEAGVGYATDVGQAGIGKATTVGQANEADASARLQAAVQLARQIGASNVGYAAAAGSAGVGKATTVASAVEADAIARLTAIVDDARRRMGYLTSDADIAVAKADEQNALDRLNALIADQNRRTGSVGLPFQLAGMDLGLKTQVTDQKYVELDALLKRINQFAGGTAAGGPNITVSTPGSVLETGQIVGAGLQGLGSAIGTAAQNQKYLDILKGIGATAGTGAAAKPGSYIGGNSYAPTSVFS